MSEVSLGPDQVADQENLVSTSGGIIALVKAKNFFLVKESVMNVESKTRILRSGKPQVALAREIGIGEPYLSRIVQGWVEPTEDIKRKIAKVLGCQIEELFPQEDAKNA